MQTSTTPVLGFIGLATKIGVTCEHAQIFTHCKGFNIEPSNIPMPYLYYLKTYKEEEKIQLLRSLLGIVCERGVAYYLLIHPDDDSKCGLLQRPVGRLPKHQIRPNLQWRQAKEIAIINLLKEIAKMRRQKFRIHMDPRKYINLTQCQTPGHTVVIEDQRIPQDADWEHINSSPNSVPPLELNHPKSPNPYEGLNQLFTESYIRGDQVGPKPQTPALPTSSNPTDPSHTSFPFPTMSTIAISTCPATPIVRDHTLASLSAPHLNHTSTLR